MLLSLLLTTFIPLPLSYPSLVTMHASRFFLAASALLVQHALAQESGKSHLKREDDVYFSPADIVKRQIPATGEAVIEPPAECAE